jgi:hypothetical protein
MHGRRRPQCNKARPPRRSGPGRSGPAHSTPHAPFMRSRGHARLLGRTGCRPATRHRGRSAPQRMQATARAKRRRFDGQERNEPEAAPAEFAHKRCEIGLQRSAPRPACSPLRGPHRNQACRPPGGEKTTRGPRRPIAISSPGRTSVHARRRRRRRRSARAVPCGSPRRLWLRQRLHAPAPNRLPRPGPTCVAKGPRLSPAHAHCSPKAGRRPATPYAGGLTAGDVSRAGRLQAEFQSLTNSVAG